mgnify:CR=1 FL=1
MIAKAWERLQTKQARGSEMFGLPKKCGGERVSVVREKFREIFCRCEMCWPISCMPTRITNFCEVRRC